MSSRPGDLRRDPVTGSAALRTTSTGSLAWIVTMLDGSAFYASSAQVEGWQELRAAEHAGPLGV